MSSPRLDDVKPPDRLHSASASTKLDRLGNEILRMIFEEVMHNPGMYLFDVNPDNFEFIDSDSLQNLRCVSRSINAVATPLRYRTIRLNSILVENYRSPDIHRAWMHIYMYTRHIVLACPVQWDLAVSLLLGCRHLNKIDLSWYGVTAGDWRPYLHYALNKVVRKEWSHCNLRVLYYRGHVSGIPELLNLSPPVTNITYLSTSIPECPDPLSIGRLVAACKNLEVLHLRALRQALDSAGDQFPAIKVLILSDCQWPYTCEDVRKLWNFSRLETLNFSGSCCTVSSPATTALAFFRSIPALETVKNFRFRENMMQDAETLTIYHSNFISHMLTIENLDLRCHLSSLHLDAICQRAHELHRLTLHDGTGFGNEKIVCPTLSIIQLDKIRANCPRITDLSLDLDGRASDIRDFVHSLSKFRNLRRLLLNMQTLLREDSDHSIQIDIDLEAAKELVSTLLKQKLGLHISSLTIQVNAYQLRGRPDTQFWDGQRLKGQSLQRILRYQWSDNSVLITNTDSGRFASQTSISDCAERYSFF